MNEQSTALSVEWVPVDRVRENPENPRNIEAAIDRVADSLQRFGWQQPIVARQDGQIIAGNTRYRAARQLEQTRVPVVWFEGDEREALAYSIADNRTHEFAEWDERALADILVQLQEEDLLEGVGYDDSDLDELIAGLEPDDDEEVEDPGAGDPPEKPVSQRGDLWLLGKHRLMCGDSLDAEQVAVLVGNARADVCVTDPPYSVDYGRSQEERGGSIDAHEAYHETRRPENILLFMAHVPADVLIWSYPVDRHFFAVADAYKSHGWDFRKELGWVKDSFSFWMAAKYQQRHEPIMVAVRKGCALGGDVPSDESTVFEVERPKSHEVHPTEKPLELWSRFVQYHASRGGVVYDPFLGSGTTMIAAEQHGRRCYAMEIAPRYVDVAVERWQKATGQDATLEGTDKTFREIAVERVGGAP